MQFIDGLFNNISLWVAILGWAIAQTIKVILDFAKNRRFSLSLFISSGAMPSSHTAFMTAMATSIGKLEGFHSPMFALSAVISLVVMYDATGVRRAAGKQAAAINMIIESFQNDQIQLDKRLKELLGHSPIEVLAGALLGVTLAAVIVR